MAERLLIIGGVAAGTKAASRARRVNRDLEITVYQEEPEPSISECGLPYLLSGVVESRERLIARTPEQFAENSIEVRVRHRVESIDAKDHRLTVRDLASGRTFDDSYDRLIIATGARATLPSVPGTQLDGVFTLRFLTDADRILGYLGEQSSKKSVVVGGGYIGLEVAENLAQQGMEVTLIEARDRLSPTYDPEISRKIEDHLEEKGVRALTNEKVEEFAGDESLRSVKFGSGELEADLAVVGVGIEPEVKLAKEAGVEIGSTGAILVDRHMKTNLPNVWAAGDCVESVNLASGEPAWVPLGDTANQMGRVAGTNAASGDNVLEFPGVLGTGILKVFDLGAGKTGLSESEAEHAGFETVCATVESKSSAGYYPGGEPVFLKLIVDAESGRLIGAQAVGAGADKLTEVCATAIWGRLTCADLVNIDLAYAPPFGPVLSPVIQVATFISGKFEPTYEGV